MKITLKFSTLLLLLLATFATKATDINGMCVDFSKDAIPWIERGKELGSWVHKQRPAARKKALEQAQKALRDDVANKWAEQQDFFEKKGADPEMKSLMNLDLNMSSDAANFALLNPEESTAVIQKGNFDQCIYYLNKGKERASRENAETNRAARREQQNDNSNETLIGIGLGIAKGATPQQVPAQSCAYDQFGNQTACYSSYQVCVQTVRSISGWHCR